MSGRELSAWVEWERRQPTLAESFDELKESLRKMRIA